MKYFRMPIEIEAPEEKGYDKIIYNLAESSVRDIHLKDLDIDLSNLLLFYGEHRGKKELREVIASENSALRADDVLIVPSAATALFIVATSLLNPEDHLVVIRPNYGTNLATPQAMGCEMSILDLEFDKQYHLDVEAVRAAIRPNTRLISLTNPHNPTGVVFPAATIQAIIEIAREKGCYVLVDETYRDLNFQSELIPYSALQGKHVISVCSLSKAFGVPGIRVGWIVNQDPALQNLFLAAKEQIIICNSVVDEEIALHILKQKAERLAITHERIRANFKIFNNWLGSQPHLECVMPQAGVVAFMRLDDYYVFTHWPSFYDELLTKHRVAVGPGHWFEQEPTYMRVGFGYPDAFEMQEGLERLTFCLRRFTEPRHIEITGL